MPVDVVALKRRVDLLAVVARDTRLRKVAGTGRGEWAGPCPFCGGRDRVRVQPVLGSRWCRRCGGDRWQDVVDHVVRRDGVGFVEACRLLGASSGELGARVDRRARGARVAGSLGLRRATELCLSEEHVPTAVWQKAARAPCLVGAPADGRLTWVARGTPLGEWFRGRT